MIKPELLQELIDFRRERDWEQFHNPKDLAISLSIEASELLEWFQWKNIDEVVRLLKTDKREDLEDEIADVAIYLSYLCYDLGVDLDKVVSSKLAKNETKYPIFKAKGRSSKYTDYE